MKILLYIYIIGAGISAILQLSMPQVRQSSKSLLFVTIAGIIWPILFLVGFYIGLRKAFRAVSDEDNKINH